MSENDQHINVFVRIKPVSKTSALEKCVTKAVSNKEIIIYERSQDEQASKKFSFDGVFGPSSTQLDVYNAVINPLLKEVIAGYSCTVFAYGQTGTGKTYTMEGDYANNLNWQSDTSAGIIPRSLDHLFDELQLLENQQYAIRVSFLELYNEELIDLLTNNNSPSKIKLYDDITKKGSVIIHGLEEVTVQNKTDIYRILEKGSNRRHTAATMLNSNSSRSHTVFTIMICTKENTSGGEELLKTARLNLVDLAGSEQIARSGAVDKRMREAKTINQSLLTLGRVITALVEKTPHVPYRESKLTRLLQESLGGRMKTSIIATVSSVSTNLEETRSTLDYAHRAKNITNRPEINQKVCKRELLREYTKEIESLKKDLLATREKNGICVSYDDCQGMRTLIDRQRKELQEKNNYCKVLQDTLESKEKIFNDFQSQYDAQVNELTKTMTKLKDVNGTLQMTKKMLNQVKHEKNAHERFVEKYVQNEKILLHQIDTVLDVVNEASEDAQKLHDKLDRETKTEEKYGKVGLQMMDDITERCGNITDCAFAYENEIHRFLNSLKNQVETHLAERAKNIETSIRTIVNHAIYQHAAASKELKTDINASYTHYQKVLSTHMKDASNVIENKNELFIDIYSKLEPDIKNLFESNYENIKQIIQSLRTNITKKLEDVSMQTKYTMDTICKNHLEKYHCLSKSLGEISESIKIISQNKKQMFESYKEIEMKMKNMSHGLNILDNCEKNYSKLVNASHQIDKACSNVYNQISHDEFNQNDLKNYLHILTPSINSDIDSGINQAQILNKTAFENKNVLITDLQERLNNGYSVSNQHNNKVQFTGKQLKEKMHKNEEKILISGANIFRMVENMSEAHVTFMEKQKSKISDVSRTIESNLVNQCTELNNYKNNIIEKLSESQRRIDEFLSDANFWRTIPTGTTPEKKNFSYPREFATISLSERICQRFQEDRNGLDEENNLDPTFKLSKFEVSSIENRTLFTSTPYKSPNTVYPNTNNSDYPNTSNSFIATVSATALSQTLEPPNSLRAEK